MPRIEPIGLIGTEIFTSSSIFYNCFMHLFLYGQCILTLLFLFTKIETHTRQRGLTAHGTLNPDVMRCRRGRRDRLVSAGQRQPDVPGHALAGRSAGRLDAGAAAAARLPAAEPVGRPAAGDPPRVAAHPRRRHRRPDARLPEPAVAQGLHGPGGHGDDPGQHGRPAAGLVDELPAGLDPRTADAAAAPHPLAVVRDDGPDAVAHLHRPGGPGGHAGAHQIALLRPRRRPGRSQRHGKSHHLQDQCTSVDNRSVE